MTQEHDYKAALEHLKTSPRCAFPDETVFCFTDAQYNAIAHSLTMMQKLQEPSGEMICAGIANFNLEKPVMPTMRYVLSAMIEQAEREIAINWINMFEPNRNPLKQTIIRAATRPKDDIAEKFTIDEAYKIMQFPAKVGTKSDHDLGVAKGAAMRIVKWLSRNYPNGVLVVKEIDNDQKRT